MERKARVAGRFYEQDPRELLKELERLWPKPAPAVQAALGAMVPHAGYMYSGKVAAQVYARLPQADVYVLLGPNHTGRGVPVAVATEGHWETPLGPVPINGSWARDFLNRCPEARWDDQAHRDEHSLEVQLPFLQKNGHAFSVVCLAVSSWDLKVIRSVGDALAQTARGAAGKVLFLASSDMNHFENLETTQRLDRLALERVEALDPEGLMETVGREDISMCGAAPTAALLVAAKQLGALYCDRVAYATSAEVSGDTGRVVGYAGVIIR